MLISFFTLPRPVEYLTATLGNLFARDPRVLQFDVALAYEHPEPPGLPFALGSVECSTPERLAALAAYPPGVRATYNYIRCLEKLAQGSSIGLALEDDLEFAADITRRVAALGALAAARTPRYMISLHHFYGPSWFSAVGETPAREGRVDTLLHWPQVEGFYGSQAMAMPPGVARELADGYRRHLGAPGHPLPEDSHLWYMDMGLKNLALELGITLYTVDPCLIQHVGDVSVAVTGRPPLRNMYFRPD